MTGGKKLQGCIALAAKMSCEKCEKGHRTAGEKQLPRTACRYACHLIKRRKCKVAGSNGSLLDEVHAFWPVISQMKCCTKRS